MSHPPATSSRPLRRSWVARRFPPPVELAAADEHRTPEPLPDIRQSERELIVSALGPSPVDIDELIRATGVATRKVHLVLLELDLAGPAPAPRAATCVFESVEEVRT